VNLFKAHLAKRVCSLRLPAPLAQHGLTGSV
jgi:hypothetical protein